MRALMPCAFTSVKTSTCLPSGATPKRSRVTLAVVAEGVAADAGFAVAESARSAAGEQARASSAAAMLPNAVARPRAKVMRDLSWERSDACCGRVLHARGAAGGQDVARAASWRERRVRRALCRDRLVEQLGEQRRRPIGAGDIEGERAAAEREA